MPRNAPVNILADHQGQILTIAQFIKIVRVDGFTIGFTTHDKEVVYSGVTYKPIHGVDIKELRTKIGTSPDSTEFDGIISSSIVTDEDLIGGKYEDANVTIFSINTENTGNGIIVDFDGYVGEITIKDNIYSVELLDQSSRLKQNTGRLTSATCTVKKFGDNQCKINRATYTFTCQISSIVDDYTLDLYTLNQASGYFGYGSWLKGTSGLNSGIEREIKSHTNQGGGIARVILREPFPLSFLEDDNMEIVKGCGRTVNDCKAFPNIANPSGTNVENFRGEPHLPGTTKIRQFGKPPTR